MQAIQYTTERGLISERQRWNFLWYSKWNLEDVLNQSEIMKSRMMTGKKIWRENNGLWLCKLAGNNFLFGMRYGPEQPEVPALIIHSPTSSRMSEQCKQTSEHSRVWQQSEQCWASEWINGWASGPVVTSIFLAVLDHSDRFKMRLIMMAMKWRWVWLKETHVALTFGGEMNNEK